MCVSNDAGMFPRDLLSNQIKETLNKARLTALYAICLQIFRHIAQKSLAIRQYACGISRQSAEKSDYASYAQALFSVSLTILYHTSAKKSIVQNGRKFSPAIPQKQGRFPCPCVLCRTGSQLQQQHRRCAIVVLFIGIVQRGQHDPVVFFGHCNIVLFHRRHFQQLLQ